MQQKDNIEAMTVNCTYICNSVSKFDFMLQGHALSGESYY